MKKIILILLLISSVYAETKQERCERYLQTSGSYEAKALVSVLSHKARTLRKGIIYGNLAGLFYNKYTHCMRIKDGI